MTVFNLVEKWIIRDDLYLYRFASHYGVDINFAKLKKQVITVGLVQEIAARVEDADFLIYESYGLIYVYEFKI